MDMDTKILNFLKEHRADFISGEELSHRLGVSRTAVWKHIQDLRENGYDIMAQPHQGYRLVSVPDRLLKDEITYKLDTRAFGQKVISYAAVGSTNDTAFSLAEQGAVEGTLVVAEKQTKGRGRLGRIWVSQEGGIYASLILRPEMAPSSAGLITLMAAVGIVRAIQELTGLEAQVKWPNDILIHGKKVCGILTEMSAEQDRVKFCVLGFGINVSQPANALPAAAVSLAKASGAGVRRVDVVRHALVSLEQVYDLLRQQRFAELLAAWKGHSATLGQRVKVHNHNRVLEGVAQDLDEGGALLVRDDSGKMHRVVSGDVSLNR